MAKTVLLAGGSGFIGGKLAAMLKERGYEVRLLTRRPKQAGEYYWNPIRQAIDETALAGVDYVINLAGAGISDKRWTPARKREIIDSRVKAADILFKAFSAKKRFPQTYLSASAIGIYGNSGEKLMREAEMPAQNSFLADCCMKWEQAAAQFSAQEIRTVVFRIGIVLGKEGGALAQLLKPLRFGLGTYFADGSAWWSWIHRDDLCRLFIWAIENPEASGVYNAVAPEPARGMEVVKSAAQAWQKRAVFLSVPTILLKSAMGEMSAIVLDSCRVSADRILSAGFKFRHPRLTGALDDILHSQ